MAPFVILAIETVLLRGIGWLGIGRFSAWEPFARSAIVVMFLFTGATHFSNMKYDYAAMVPEQLPDDLWTIYLTGGYCQVEENAAKRPPRDCGQVAS